MISEPNDYFQIHPDDANWEKDLTRDGYIFVGWAILDHEIGYDRYTEKAIWLKEEDIPVLPDNSSLTVIFLEGARFTDGEKMIWTLYDESDKTIKGNHDYPVLTPGFDLKKQITAKENITQTDAIRIINIVSEQLPFYDLVLGRNKARRIY